MPRNKYGGNSAKKYGNKNVNMIVPIQYALSDQKYATVSKSLGSCKFYVETDDGKKFIGVLKKGIKHLFKIEEGNVVLISERSCNSQKTDIVDIIFKYSNDQIDILHNKELLKKDELKHLDIFSKVVIDKDEDEESDDDETNVDLM